MEKNSALGAATTAPQEVFDRRGQET